MTIIPWPADRKPRRARATPPLAVDPLPQSVLHALVANIPGPPRETAAERDARFKAQLAEVLSQKPRDTVEAMVATQAIMLRLVARQPQSEPAPDTAEARKARREDRQLEQMIARATRSLAKRQSQPLTPLDPAIFQALGLTDFLIPAPEVTDDPARFEEAVSAVIVPLHPAPKMLQ